MTWLKQTSDSPLFPDLDWEKPERKDQAGRLIIIGGNLHGFSSVSKADSIAKEQGIGSTKVFLPDVLRKTIGPLWTEAIFCPSTASGGFSKKALDLLLQNALSADGLLLSGDFGRNSETAVVIDRLIESLNMPIAVTKDALDYYLERPRLILENKHVVAIGSFSQMQKLLSAYGHDEALVYTMPLASLVGTLSRFTEKIPATLITKSGNTLLAAQGSRVVTTKLDIDTEIWRLETATRAIVSVIHHPNKYFEAINNAIV